MTGDTKRTLRVLHIGVSNRGEWPLAKCNESTGFVPAALCDVNLAALEKARAITGLPESACFTDVDLAFKNAKVDCVIICAPTVLHVPLCKKAIAAGLPVLVEKGMAPDWNSARDLVSTARRSNAIAAVAQNYRYSPVERTIWRAIHDPAFEAYVGPVHLVMYTQNRVRPVPRTLNYPFASVWDMSCHHFDNLLYWFGPMMEMTAFSWRAHWSAYEHDNNTSAHIVFKNKTCCHYIHTHDAARNTLEIQIHGERGALVRRDDTLTFNLRPIEQFGARPELAAPMEVGHGESDVLRDFHAYITRGIEPGISVANNLETMAACEMMTRSITEKQTCRRTDLNA
jgi:predicted dehydrogenase